MSDNFKKLENLADELLKDLLEATDEEIIAEAVEDGIDVNQAVASVHSLIEQSRYMIAQENIRAQKTELSSQKGKVIDIGEARKKVIKALEQNPNYADSLTMAARSGKNLPDEDILGYYEDMVELGLIKEGQDSDDK
jgi:Mg2+ and Co2+ transporter CorA